MAKTEFNRNIDSLGRLVIPKQFRKKMDIPDEGGTVIVTCVNGTVTVSKATVTCIFCESKKDLTEFKGRTLCRKCLKELSLFD